MAEFQLPASLFRTSGLVPTDNTDNSTSDNFDFGGGQSINLGLLSEILSSLDPSNYQYNGIITSGGLDIGNPNRPTITTSPQNIADAFNISKDLAAQVIGDRKSVV